MSLPGASESRLLPEGADPAISMVFVSTDEGEVLLDALESLLESDPRHSLEVVVIDNASTDGARQEIAKRWPRVRVIPRQTRHGLPSNLNLGVRETSAPFVMLCNSDLVFPKGSVDLLADFLEAHPRAGIAAPKLIGPDGRRRSSARRWYTWPTLLLLRGPWRSWANRIPAVKRNTYSDWDFSAPRLVDWVPCPATLVRRAAFDEVGLMDERFWVYFDDVDISLRMHDAGWGVWCVPQAEIVHLEQRSSVAPFSSAWRWHLESLFKFWWKHKGLKPKGSKAKDREAARRKVEDLEQRK